MAKKFLKNRGILQAVILGMSAAFCFFLLDVILDIIEHFESQRTYTKDEAIHLFFETCAVVALFLGILSVLQYTKVLSEQAAKANKSLAALKVDFDNFVQQQFTQWGLTEAEKDVALLLLRGMSTSDIADLRSSTTGTVKVQSHKVFGKSGVTSRVEFMSLFMEEFIDIGIAENGKS